MVPAISFAVLTLILLLLMVYFSQLLIFTVREKKRFERGWEDPDYLSDLQKRYRKAKRSRIRNFLLFYIVETMKKQGDEVGAEKMSAFLRSDSLLGIIKQ